MYNARHLSFLAVVACFVLGLTIRPSSAVSVSVCTSGCDYANLTSAFASLLQQGPNVTNVVNVAAGTYNENGRVSSYSVILNIDPAGVTLVTTNRWTSLVNVVGALTIQGGPLTIYGLGLSVESGKGPFNLATPLTLIDCYQGLSLGYGVVFNQNAPLNITLAGDSMSNYAFYVYDHTTWIQEGDVYVEAYDATAIYLVDGSYWNQTGTVTVALGQSADGVYVSKSVWLQGNSITVTGTNKSETDKTGVYISGGIWNQTGPASIDLGKSSTGVVLSFNASWTQTGDVTILNYIYGSGVNSYTSVPSSSWFAQGNTTINAETGGIGVNFQAEDVLLVSGTIFVSAVNQTCAVSYEPAISCNNCTGAYNISISAGNTALTQQEPVGESLAHDPVPHALHHAHQLGHALRHEDALRYAQPKPHAQPHQLGDSIDIEDALHHPDTKRHTEPEQVSHSIDLGDAFAEPFTASLADPSKKGCILGILC
ncbi:uncharacterized protein ACA1_233430 [Acanthamoeba castellanii str. Neff]|uniref:DUF1565 domain-containing protein n=1 Tax=Acanthamoeba castellanii (strain ATCC 30010 / Neff) TaxID=1257118 RepID=L8H112_ACACF|nr:uncharacterized protein ACA1_233430 [Acanthamoeba castellanii str. Neff]ELR18945.1 hypothetical protein ACA1_233430 [Acanthamoeba castellanii str. Neff]